MAAEMGSDSWTFPLGQIPAAFLVSHTGNIFDIDNGIVIR